MKYAKQIQEKIKEHYCTQNPYRYVLTIEHESVEIGHIMKKLCKEIGNFDFIASDKDSFVCITQLKWSDLVLYAKVTRCLAEFDIEDFLLTQPVYLMRLGPKKDGE